MRPPVLKRGAIDTGTAFLVALVLAAVAGLVYLYVIGAITGDSDAITHKQICKQSVEQSAQARYRGVDWSDSVICPTQEVTVNAKDDDAIKEEIARSMYDCWDIFGGNSHELFPTERDTEERFCVICSVMEFEEQKQVAGFWNHLSENSPPGKQESYYEIFKGEPLTRQELENIEQLGTNHIDTQQDYAVLYTYEKTTGTKDRLSEASVWGTVGVVVGGASGFFTGGIGWVVTGIALGGGAGYGYGIVSGPDLAVDWQASVYAIPYTPEALAEFSCTRLPARQQSS